MLCEKIANHGHGHNGERRARGHFMNITFAFVPAHGVPRAENISTFCRSVKVHPDNPRQSRKPRSRRATRKEESVLCARAQTNARAVEPKRPSGTTTPDTFSCFGNGDRARAHADINRAEIKDAPTSAATGPRKRASRRVDFSLNTCRILRRTFRDIGVKNVCIYIRI